MATVSERAMVSFPTSIRHKLSLIVVCAVLIAIVIATAASAWREANRFAAAKQAELTGTAQVFASAVADELATGSRSGAYQKLRAIGRIPGLAFARVEDTQGRRFAEIGTAVMLEHRGRDGWFSSISLLFERSVEVRADIRKSGQVIGRLIMVADASELRERLWEGLVAAAFAAVLAALIGIVLAWRWQRRITVPIQNLTQAMEEVRANQDFSTQVTRETDDETGVMVDTFNDMLSQIRTRDERLAEHRSQLEFKVEERTRDLRSAKEAAEAANVAKSEFLATMSHEIRTPMNGMLVMAELMSGAELAPRQQRYAEVIVKSGQSLLSIINDILDFSKIESGNMDLERIALDPAEVIDDVLNLFWERASSKGVDLAGYVGADVPAEIEGDPVRLNQVLSNLVNNALKFTEAGHVVVLVRRSPIQTPAGDGLAIEFSVKDTGIGIPEDKLASIFSAFSQADQTTTRKYGGTGLGLAICKRLVGAMGGEIGVTSTPGKGSAFSFTVATRALGASPELEPSGDSRLRRAVVAVTGSITPKAIAGYLRNHGIGFDLVAPNALTAETCAGADAVFLAPDLVGRIAAAPSPGDTAPSPCIVCVSELGDGSSDDHLDSGRAHDLIMRPISRRSMGEVIARLAAGTPLGRDATRRGRNTAVELPSFAGARVLVADDSAINREVI
ncbi:MAG: ATP-binding protein, partial [Hyphomicrobiales bacterium]